MTKSQYKTILKMCQSSNFDDHTLAYELMSQFNTPDIVKRYLLNECARKGNNEFLLRKV